jgi:hypothetical protein
MQTLEELKKHIKKHWETGTDCPVCHQHVKLYKRKITSSMAYALYYIFQSSHESIKSGGDGWVHVESMLKELSGCPSSIRGDFPKLRYWNLIEKKPGITNDGNPSNGYYRTTNLAMDFIKHGYKVFEYVKIYNNQFYGFDGLQITFNTALTNKFNYINNIQNDNLNKW